MLENSWTNTWSQELRNSFFPPTLPQKGCPSPSFLDWLAGGSRLCVPGAAPCHGCAPVGPAWWLLTQRLALLYPGEVFNLGRGLHSPL